VVEKISISPEPYINGGHDPYIYKLCDEIPSKLIEGYARVYYKNPDKHNP
jgi:hypothetical protein